MRVFQWSLAPFDTLDILSKQDDALADHKELGPRQWRHFKRPNGARYIVGVSLASEDWRAKAGEASAQPTNFATLIYLLASFELGVETGALTQPNDT